MFPPGEFAVAGLDWLTGNCWMFGLAGQNWMLVAGGGLLVYIGALAVVRYRQTRHGSAS